MNQKTIIKAIVALLVVVLVFTFFASTQTAAPLQVSDGSMVNVSQAQAIWSRTYGGSGDDRCFYLLPKDGGYLAVGSTKIDGVLNGWALLLDGNGDVVWNQTYLDGAGTELRWAAALSDGYLLAGNQYTAGGDQNGYVAKVTSTGDLVWQQVSGGSELDKTFGGVVSGGNLYLYGLTTSSEKSVGWAVKLDFQGNVLWDKSYPLGKDAVLRSAVASGDGLVAAGYVDFTGDGDYDFLLLKISSTGDLSWNHTYGGLESQKAYSIAAGDDGYLLVGESGSTQTSTDAYLVKTNFNGVMQWSKTLGGQEADSPSYVTEAEDGGFLVCGFTFSFGMGQRDFWLFKLSNIGQVLFSCTYGCDSFQEAYGVIDLGGNHYVMAGWSDPEGNPELVGKAQYDFLVAELDLPLGCTTINCWFIGASVISAGALVAILVLLLKMRPKKQK